MGGFNIAGGLGFLAGIVVGASAAAGVLAVGLSEVPIAVAAVPLLFRPDVPTTAWLDAE